MIEYNLKEQIGKIKPIEFVVLYYLTDKYDYCMKNKSKCLVSYSMIKDNVGIGSYSTIKNILDNLNNLGLIETKTYNINGKCNSTTEITKAKYYKSTTESVAVPNKKCSSSTTKSVAVTATKSVENTNSNTNITSLGDKEDNFLDTLA